MTRCPGGVKRSIVARHRHTHVDVVELWRAQTFPWSMVGLMWRQRLTHNKTPLYEEEVVFCSPSRIGRCDWQLSIAAAQRASYQTPMESNPVKVRRKSHRVEEHLSGYKYETVALPPENVVLKARTLLIIDSCLNLNIPPNGDFMSPIRS